MTFGIAENSSAGQNTIGEGRKRTDPVTPQELASLRSCTGSLAWLSGQGRPDIAYRVSRLQSSVKGATVETLQEANKILFLAQQVKDSVKLVFPAGHFNWKNVAVITVTDAIF